MAKLKRAVQRALNPAPLVSAAKSLKISLDIAKYIGYEPVWEGVDITEDNRQSHLMSGFNWYNYSFGSKDAQAFMVEYLTINNRKAEAKQVKRASDLKVQNALGWLSRMTMMGWELSEVETKLIEDEIKNAIASIPVKLVVDDQDQGKKFNIQDRMREIAAEAGGEMENMLDEFIKDGCKARHDFKPVNILKTANVLPQHITAEIEHWEKITAEFKEAYAGKDKELKEAYGHFSKIQLRSLVKFGELIVAEHRNYVSFKKANKKTRKRKVKTPVELARKLKFLPTFQDLDLTSIKPAKVIGAKEMFAYDTKKRKLMYFVADEYAGTLSIKNNTIDGFDANKSVQKTIRKPKEQLKGFMAASRPNTRKAFDKTKSVETKMSGRFNSGIVILKVW